LLVKFVSCSSYNPLNNLIIYKPLLLTYAIIGVLFGMAVEPVGRFAKHGPTASP